MSGITGRQTKIAFAKFGTNSWGTPASVTYGAYFTSDGGMKLDPNIIVDDAFGQVFEGTEEVGDIKPPTPNWDSQARYDDYSYIFQALAMGSPNAPTISTSAAGQTTSWQHIIDLADVIDGLGITAAIDKVLYVEELTSAKIHGFNLKRGNGGIMTTAYKVTGSKPTIASATNTRSTVNGATFPALGNRVFAKHGTFRMNLNSAGALGSGDVVHVENVEFDYDRPQDSPQVFGQDYIDEPADNAFPTFGLTVSYPRMNTVTANSLYGALRDATAMKADLTFLGAFINSTDQHQKLYQWPYLQLSGFEAPITGGAAQVKPKATFKALLAPSSPTGMAFVRPSRLTIIQTNSPAAF
jgi:hypothetical protein